MSSPSGTESIELSDAKELLIVSTNEAERQLATSKFNEALQNSLEKGRSKSKSPRRTRRDREDVPPSPAPHKGWKICSSSTGSVTSGLGLGSGASSSSKAAPPRRPHTSAGPRDKAYDFAGARLESAYNRERDARAKAQDEEDVHKQRRAGGAGSRPSTSQGESKRRSTTKGYSFFGAAPRLGTALSGSSTGTSGSGSVTASTSRSATSSVSSNGGDDDRMREWEEELAKIEMRSRRSSDMLGFAGKRKRSAGAPRLGEGSSSQSEA